MILNMANMIVAKYVTIMEYFTTFSASQGSKIAQNGDKTVHHCPSSEGSKLAQNEEKLPIS